MYASIFNTDMFILRGSHDFERMDDTQLADLGIERQGDVFLHTGKLVHQIPRFRGLLSRLMTVLAPPQHLRPARA